TYLNVKQRIPVSSPGLTGRSSIPETVAFHREASGILDAPVKPGHDSEEDVIQDYRGGIPPAGRIRTDPCPSGNTVRILRSEDSHHRRQSKSQLYERLSQKAKRARLNWRDRGRNILRAILAILAASRSSRDRDRRSCRRGHARIRPSPCRS